MNIHCKLKWASHPLKTDKGIVSPEVAERIAKLAAELKVTPEEVALAWLRCVCENHSAPQRIEDPRNEWSVSTIGLQRHVSDAIERARGSQTRSEFLETILHEKFLLEDPIYEGQWIQLQKQALRAKHASRPSA